MSKNRSRDILERLAAKYGEILTLKQLAEVLCYSSVGAIRTAHHRGTLPVALYRFPGKRGRFAKVEEVADCLKAMESAKEP